ncbi:hypothetical protein [Burkholderia glumae]
MSSIAFIEVEGRFAMPSSRSCAPSSYGHEWALLPPAPESRTGIRSLYAAIVRTVCLDIDAFLAASRWDRGRDAKAVSATIPAAVHAPPAAEAPLETKLPEPRGPAANAFPDEARPISLPKTPRYRAARRSPHSLRRRAGQIGIVGAAMLLGWIVIGHVPPKPERNGAVDVWQGAVNGSSSRRAAPVALRQAGADVEPSSADAIASPRRTPISKHAAAGAPTRDESKRNHAQAGTGLARVDSRRLASSHAFAPHREPARPTASVDRSRQARRASRSASHHDVNARRGLVASDAFDINDYADLVNELRQRSAIATRNEQPTTGTEWADQISQRRLTDIPEQFSQ